MQCILVDWLGVYYTQTSEYQHFIHTKILEKGKERGFSLPFNGHTMVIIEFNLFDKHSGHCIVFICRYHN